MEEQAGQAADRDIRKMAENAVTLVIEKHFQGNRSAFAKEAGVKQTTLNGFCTSHRVSLETLTQLCQNELFYGAFLEQLIAHLIENPSWNRVAKSLSEIMSLPEAWRIIDSLQNLAENHAVERGIRAVEEVAKASEDGKKIGRTHPLTSVKKRKKSEKTAT